MERPSEVTRLLRAASTGDRVALDELFPLVYDELRVLARSCLVGDGAATLQPTALVHEAWMRLSRQESLGVEHERAFFGAAATVMRRILVDAARARGTRRRGDGQRDEPLPDEAHLAAAVEAFESRGADLVRLEEALEKLEHVDERKARLVELRFFAGLGMREAAAALDVSLRQAERDWTMARAWLHGAITDGGAADDARVGSPA
ncbi:MAG: ECF-type sigma factor [Planctomycetota bacterium]